MAKQVPKIPAAPNRLRELREAAGLSQPELAAMVGTDKSQIYRLEKGERQLSFQWAIRLAEALKVPPIALMPPEMSRDRLVELGEANKAGFEEPADLFPVDPADVAPDLTSNAVRPFRKDFDSGRPRDLPVFGRALAGTLEEGEDEGWLEFNGEMLDILQRPPVLDAVPDAYAVWVSGPSMEPRYFDGELAYVNPRKPVRVGHFVVVQVRARRPGAPPRGLVKRLKGKSVGKILLVSLNPPDSKPIEIPASQIISMHRIVLGGEG